MKSERKREGNEESKQNRDLVRQQSQTEILTSARGWEKSKKDTKIRSVHRTRHLIQINIDDEALEDAQLQNENVYITQRKKRKIIFRKKFKISSLGLCVQMSRLSTLALQTFG
jgi:hypothetical protein